MLHSVILNYLRPEDVSKHLDAHKQWLIRGFDEGKILFAGPLSNGTGGYILFYSENENAVNDFLKEDPFVKDNIVDVASVSFEPALCAKRFPGNWAAKARII